MKLQHYFFILFSSGLFSQEKPEAKIADFNSCPTISCKIEKALEISEYYLETDQTAKSQKWLNYAKNNIYRSPNKKNQYLANSLQSELFYYMGLYQFGIHEAQKGIEISREMNDSLYISNAYLIEGVNYFEILDLKKAEYSFQRAKNYFPKKYKAKSSRFQVNDEYIYNNLAQLKIKTDQLDSSYIYNQKAYIFAKKSDNSRCIANVERTFGELFLNKKMQDSARIYFDKSVRTSVKSKIYDTALLGYGNLMQTSGNNMEAIKGYFTEGENLIRKHHVNSAFQKLFYLQSLQVFKSINDKNPLLYIQDKLLLLDQKINQNENFYIQNITNQYINSENKLLLSKINQLDKQKNIQILQLVATLLCILILLLIIIIIRRKNKLQKSLLEQKNEISKDLHDDIGSELSSILINTNLLIANYDTNERQKKVIEKISHTSFEISQRLNTFIWSLNTDNNTVQNFCEYVKHYLNKFLDGTIINLDYQQQIEEASHKILNGNARKNLFFCIKEALNNIVKHANANEVTLKIEAIEKNQLLIQIQDNGIGMLQCNAFGNGLLNMKKRIHNLNGSFELKSDNGLIIKIIVPIR